MDTIVIATGMPFLLAFLDQRIEDVIELWESWVASGELVPARHEDTTRDAAIRLRPAAFGVTEFVPNEPGGRLFKDRMLWALPALHPLSDSEDTPPNKSHYWTLQMSGFTARPETLAGGATGLVVGRWELGRL